MRMPLTLQTMIAALALAGCGAGSDAPVSAQLSNQQSVALPSGNPTGVQTAAGWTAVSITTSCEAMNPSYCVGRFGFTVDSTGNFVIGPNAANQTLKGQVTSAELTAIKQDLDTLVPDYSAGTATMCSQTFIPGVATNVLVSATDGKSYVIKDAFRQYCGSQQAAASDLLSQLGSILKNYYPIPF